MDLQRDKINPVSMKVFLDREEDSFLLHKVENRHVVMQSLPLSITHRGGLSEVGAHSEADDHKRAGQEGSEHQIMWNVASASKIWGRKRGQTTLVVSVPMTCG